MPFSGTGERDAARFVQWRPAMLYQLIAVAGALMVLAGYVSYQQGWLGREDRLYSLLNALGAALLTWVAVVDRRWGFVLLEGTWTLLSIPPLIRPPRPAPPPADAQP